MFQCVGEEGIIKSFGSYESREREGGTEILEECVGRQLSSSPLKGNASPTTRAAPKEIRVQCGPYAVCSSSVLKKKAKGSVRDERKQLKQQSK